mmetsp:Transcript_12498/g.23925  ORF Transcript_12498/g.23925 Transcript_12498/m.23925 type:complete len:90 (+) Transcript_12498:211-480(+)
MNTVPANASSSAFEIATGSVPACSTSRLLEEWHLCNDDDDDAGDDDDDDIDDDARRPTCLLHIRDKIPLPLLLLLAEGSSTGVAGSEKR